MIRTIVWFASGGLFTAVYSNALRRVPLLRKPSKHIVFTLIGFGIGLAVHRFEENSEEIFKKLIQKHKNADWYPEGLLLAERAARLQSLKAGEEGVVAVDIEDEFEDVEDEEDDE